VDTNVYISELNGLPKPLFHFNIINLLIPTEKFSKSELSCVNLALSRWIYSKAAKFIEIAPTLEPKFEHLLTVTHEKILLENSSIYDYPPT
jgi:hypothetical protein